MFRQRELNLGLTISIAQVEDVVSRTLLLCYEWFARSCVGIIVCSNWIDHIVAERVECDEISFLCGSLKVL